jgi:hypothetical protein
MATNSFDRSSSGAVRLARTHLRAQAQRSPVAIVLEEDVLDLDDRGLMDAGSEVTVHSALAEALIARGAARRADG